MSRDKKDGELFQEDLGMTGVGREGPGVGWDRELKKGQTSWLGRREFKGYRASGRARLAAGCPALRVAPWQGPAGRWTPSMRPCAMAPPWL